MNVTRISTFAFAITFMLLSTPWAQASSREEIVHPTCNLVLDLKLVRKGADYRFNIAQDIASLGYKVTKSTVYPSNRAKAGELYLVSLPFAIIRDPENNHVGCKCGVEILERYEEIEKSQPVVKDRDVTGVISSYSEFSCTFALEELLAAIPPCRVSESP